MFYQLNKKGSIGITIIMLVFGLLMSVAMSYQKMLQTETLVQGLSDNSDRAMDAAFSGVNYAMASIQGHPEVFKKPNTDAKKVFFLPDPGNNPPPPPSPPLPPSSILYISDWIKLNNEMVIYFDENSNTEKHPPYRFKVGCSVNNYKDDDKVYIKSIGEYLKYENNDLSDSHTAQIIAECFIDRNTRTIKLKRYRKMVPNEIKLYEFNGYDEE